MKVQGKSLFTTQSVHQNKPELKPDVKQAIEQIRQIMKQHSITEVRI